VDENGRKIFHSGAVEQDGRGPVETGAHFYRSLQLDEHGNPINKRNAWGHTLSRLRAADRARGRRYDPLPSQHSRRLWREDFPEGKGELQKVSWWNTQWAYAGVRDPEHKGYSTTPAHDDGRWVFTGDTSKVSGTSVDS
jgi:hypothetical protein